MNIPNYIKNLKPYSSARSILKDKGLLFLDANECPYRNLLTGTNVELNRYPDPTADGLRSAISRHYGLKAGQVIIGNGSDELIDLAMKTFIRPKRAVLSVTPAYGLYEVRAKANGLGFIKVPFTSRFKVDIKQLMSVTNKADLLMLCSPNNPTGSVIDTKTLEQVTRRYKGLVVVDEAYGEFSEASGQPSAIGLIKKGIKNLLVLRTFSKAFAAAGLRLGYAIGCAEVVSQLIKVKPPYNVNSLSQYYGLKLWSRRKKMLRNIKKIINQRDGLMEKFRKYGLEVIPSSANFFLVRLPSTISSQSVYNRLKDNYGIVLRIFADQPLLENTLRITVGTAQENRKLLEAFKQSI